MPEAVIQAIASKVTVIASDIPAHNELLDIVNFGSVVDFSDTDDVLKAIEVGLSERSIASQQEKFIDVFNIDNVVKKYDAIYTSLLN